MERRIYRSNEGKIIGGVCQGLANYFSVDVTLIRLLLVLIIFAKGVGLLAYIICWIVIPEEPNGYVNFSPNEQRSDNNTKYLGIGLIILGAAFFAAEYFDSIEKLWPLVIVAIGVWIVYQSVKGDKNE